MPWGYALRVPPLMSPQISTHSLSKRFRVAVKGPGLLGALGHLLRPRFQEKVAVEELDLAIEAGERVAFLGPNGAGKSTTIKMLTGIVTPTSGELRVCGLVPHQDRMRNARNISVIFGQRTQLWWDLPVRESLRLIADIYEVPPQRLRQNLDDCVDLLELGPLLALPTRTLSLGQRMRCDVAAALLHDPAILFLDEPTLGLDFTVKERVHQLIRHVNETRGTTVVLTSHDMADIEGLCERILIINQGRLAFDGSRETLNVRFRQERIVRVALKESMPEAGARCAAALSMAGVWIEQPDPRHVLLSFDPTLQSAAAIIGAVLPLLPAQDLRVEEPPLQAVIRKIYASPVRGPA
jgi:ABC-2 type transport system ATP-binding protein